MDADERGSIERDLTGVKDQRAGLELQVEKTEKEAEEAIEEAARMSRIRIKKDHEPIQLLRASHRARWESEIEAAARLKKQQEERTSKLEKMKDNMTRQQEKMREVRTDVERKLDEAKKDGDETAEARHMLEKRENDKLEMELQRDRRELEARMRREAVDGKEIETEVAIRTNIATTKSEQLAVAEKIDENDCEMTVLRQEVKLLRASTTDENDPEIQDKMERLHQGMEHLRGDRASLSKEERELEARAQTHVTVYDRHLESCIQQEKIKVARQKSLMKEALLGTNPNSDARASAESLLMEETKLEKLKEEMLSLSKLSEEDESAKLLLDREIDQDRMEIRQMTSKLVHANPTGMMVAENIWTMEQSIERLEERLKRVDDERGGNSASESSRRKLEERIKQESSGLAVLKTQMTKLVAANPSTRMSAAKLHQMEGKLERLTSQRRERASKALVHRKSQRALAAKIAEEKEVVAGMESVLVASNPQARIIAEDLHKEEENLLRLQSKRISLERRVESDREETKSMMEYEEKMLQLEREEEVIMAEEDLQIDPTHHGEDEAEVAAHHEVEERLKEQRLELEERRMELLLRTQEDVQRVRSRSAKLVEENEREVKSRQLSELQEMRRVIESQEEELASQRELLREQKKATSVETPRMRSRHLEELREVGLALEVRESELEKTKGRMQQEVQSQLVEVEKLHAKSAERAREEAKEAALALARREREEERAKRAMEMDEIRMAMVVQKEDLNRKSAMVQLQQSRSLGLPIARKWAQQQRLRTARKKIQGDREELGRARRALEKEAETGVQRVMERAQLELRDSRTKMTEQHLEDLDAATGRVRERERELQRETSNSVARAAASGAEAGAEELEEKQRSLKKRKLELEEERQRLEEEAEKRIADVREASRVEGEALRRSTELKIELELERQRDEMEKRAAKQRREMEEQTKHLLEMQKITLEEEGRRRAEADSEAIATLKMEASKLGEERKRAEEEFRVRQEELREEHQEKVAALAEGAEEARMSLAAELKEAKEKREGQERLKELSEEIRQVDEEYVDQLTELTKTSTEREELHRTELASAMGVLEEMADVQLAHVDQIKKEVDDGALEERGRVASEMKKGLDEARERHMTYVTEMEEIVSEREGKLRVAQEKHRTEQRRMMQVQKMVLWLGFTGTKKILYNKYNYLK